jgi:hypothetical protein
MNFKILNKIFLFISISVFAFGCAPQDSTEFEDAGSGYLMHVVSYQGETLGLISKWYTGSSANWKRILNANPALKPTRMRIGDNIRIPRYLVRRHEALPAHAIPKRSAKKAKPQVKEILMEDAEVEDIVESEGITFDEESSNETDAMLEELMADEPSEAQMSDDSVTSEVEAAAITTSEEESLPPMVDETADVEKVVDDKNSEVQQEAEQSNTEREKLLDELLAE